MKVLCINGSEGILEDGEVYTVIQVSKLGNYILEEVAVPEGYTNFDSNRFIPLQTTDLDELVEDEYFQNN